MNHVLKIFFLLLMIGFSTFVNCQPCDGIQELSSDQLSQIELVLPQYETALQQEELLQIDDLSNQLIIIFGIQAGWPEKQETYVVLNPETNWLAKEETVLLSRQLIDNDEEIYAECG